VFKPLVASLFTNPQQVGQIEGISAAYEQRAVVEYKNQVDPVSQIQHIFRIANAACIEQADLITAGVDKEFGYNDIHNQSLSNLVTQAKCPALLIPEQATFKPLKKIVLVIDHEFNITHRMSFLAQLAGVFEAELIFLQINTEKSWITEHPFYASSIDMYLAFPYAQTSFHEVVNECIPEAIGSFTEKIQADLIITVPNKLDQMPYMQATSLHYNEFSARPLSIPLLALDTQAKETVNIGGYPFN
jgi:hypothetical protein